MGSAIRSRYAVRPLTQSTAGPILSLAHQQRKSGSPLLSWDELPTWAKDNEFIHSGFRPISNSYLDCFKSCFYIHNESGNIYSHLLAMLWMIILPMYFYPYARTNYGKADADDWIVFGLYFFGGALCFGLSTAYHAVSCHSHATHDVYHRLDLLGISTVTAGCFPPGMFYTFPCLARGTKMFWISVCGNPLFVIPRATDIDILSSAGSFCADSSSHISTLCATDSPTGMEAYSWLPILFHGFISFLSDHLRHSQTRLWQDGR